ncbi:putative mandelate racemase / muconate lactonizing enzyme family protein [Pectobacterium atrosepticum SCRI1043]|uniref:Dipeptide epimerase n=3 Tax=Pectobacteriaceae TaxID=1903410 RepID=Q6DAW3_PECAS|nr:muconate cycloisomerase [Pectobacterium peruviense]MCL6318603.1 L-Ala-D/L-Glu epimerase [Pectobacterium atrosepticum]CAG73059.1 putative mandelate racemase / muconate lactonizing enzyme family protein [Pectobacterium atrosepticum SCRI1043]MCL6323131.1 L-Ala-D/L-Glu epimerase [Pectobacterium atrosepticum]PKX83499.1 dipeptide epimerase [Pectobacterium peruviense]
MMRHMQIETVNLPLARPMAAENGTRHAVTVIRVALEEKGFIGQGECTPAAHYGESADSVCRQLSAIREAIENGLTIEQLQQNLSPGAARNALDCALWRLNTALEKQTLWQRVGIHPPTSVVCAQTLALDSVEKMATAASNAVSHGALLLKIKLDRELILEKVAAIRAAAPNARLIIDARASWSGLDLHSLSTALLPYQVAMIEQPLPVGKDEDLQRFAHPIPICADESCRHSGDIVGLRRRYDMINIKLDKCGGLTEALAMVREAHFHGLRIMVGCTLGSSMAMEAALPVAADAEHVDLDGPIWLAADSSPYLTYNLGRIWL